MLSLRDEQRCGDQPSAIRAAAFSRFLAARRAASRLAALPQQLPTSIEPRRTDLRIEDEVVGDLMQRQRDPRGECGKHPRRSAAQLGARTCQTIAATTRDGRDAKSAIRRLRRADCKNQLFACVRTPGDAVRRQVPGS